MGYLPTKIDDLLNFCDVHSPIFIANAPDIGLSSGEASAFQKATADAVAAVTAAEAANEAKLVAYQEARQAVAELRRVAGGTINAIKAYAALQTNPATVYNTASLPPPSAPSPVPPPALPYDIRVGVRLDDGAIELRWKASNPDGSAGTVYIIRRRTTLTGQTVFVGTAGGTKSFVDTSLPTGTDAVTYLIHGQRSGINGPTAEVNVRFGAGGAGGPGVTGGGVLSVTESQSNTNGPVKFAA